MITKTPGHISDIVFHDINLYGESGRYHIEVGGYDEQHLTENVKFGYFKINGSYITQDSKNVRLGDYISNIVFESSDTGVH